MLDKVRLLVDALASGRPGLLGWPGFYWVLGALYGLVVLAFFVQVVRQLLDPDKAWAMRYWAVAILVFGLLHGLIYSVANPPWMAPDEPSHFEYARLMAELGRVPQRDDLSDSVQGEILASMYAFDFWRMARFETPERAPKKFSNGLGGDWEGLPPTFVVNDQFLAYVQQVGNEPPLYYFLMQPAFWPWLTGGNIVHQYYMMRWLSVLLYVGCALITLWVGQRVFADIPELAIGASFLMVVQPMFSFIGTSANNDVVGALLGTLWFACAVLLFTKERFWLKIGAFLVVTLLALLAKKTVFFVAPLFIVALLLYWPNRRALRWLPYAVGGGLLAGLLLLVGGLSLRAPQHADMWVARPNPNVGVRSVTQVYAGEAAFRVGGAETPRATRLVQALPAAAMEPLRGKTVVLEAQLMAEADGQYGRLRLVDDKGPLTTVFTATREWQSVRVTYTLPANLQFLRVQLLSGQDDEDVVSVVYFDDVRLQVLDAQDPPVNLLVNGSAESSSALLRSLLVGIARPLGLDSYILPWFMQPVQEDWGKLLPLSVYFSYVTFWGRFGSLNILMTVFWENVWKVLGVLGLLGVIVYFIKNRSADTPQRNYVLLLGLGWFANWGLIMLPLIRRPDRQWLPQGRFLFPAVMPLILLLYLGLANLLPKVWRAWLLPVLMIIVLLLDTFALKILFQAYYV